MAARSRAGGAARRRFPTLESGSAVRVGSVAGRSSRRRRLVSGRRRREAAEGARSCCSSGAMSTRVSRRRAASWSSIDTRESQSCSGTTCRRGGPGATERSGLLTTARGHRRSFLTSRRLRRESARRREKLRAPGLVCRRSFSTLYPTRRQRGRAVAASASFLGSGATARRYQSPSRDRLDLRRQPREITVSERRPSARKAGDRPLASAGDRPLASAGDRPLASDGDRPPRPPRPLLRGPPRARAVGLARRHRRNRQGFRRAAAASSAAR